MNLVLRRAVFPFDSKFQRECSGNKDLFYYFVQLLTNTQLIDKLSYSSYMFRHYCVILSEFAVSTLPSFTSMSNEVVDNTIQN